MSGAPLPSVLALCGRGEAYRTFGYSGAFAAMGALTDLHVAGVDPGEEVLAELAPVMGPLINLGTAEEPAGLARVRGLLDMAHGRRLWSEAARERYRKRDLEALGHPVRRSRRAIAKAMARLVASEAMFDRLVAVERRIAQGQPEPASVTAAFDALQPHLVFNTSHSHTPDALPWLEAAIRRGIPTATYLFSWDNLTSQGRIPIPADHYLAWNRHIAADLRRIYPSVTPSQVRVTGAPQFDPHFHSENIGTRAWFCEQVGLDPERPIVLYTTSMPGLTPGEDEIVERLHDDLAARSDLGGAQLLVRAYAKDRSGRFERLRQRRPDLTFAPVAWRQSHLTPLPADTQLWSTALAHAACGVNVASTTTLELCMFDVPVINVAFNPPSVSASRLDYRRYYRFEHYRPVAESGAVHLATSPTDLVDAIVAALRAPSDAALERRALLEHMFDDTLDGASHQRVADAIGEIASNSGGPSLTGGRA